MTTNRRLVGLRELHVECSVGILEHEQRAKQTVIVSVCVETAAQAAHGDDIAEVLDYREIRAAVLEVAQAAHYGLLETMVDRIAGRLAALPRTSGVVVRLAKPGAFTDAKAAVVQVASGSLASQAAAFWA